MKILIADSEWNGLQPDKCWVYVFKDFKKDNWYVFINDDFYGSHSWNDLVRVNNESTRFAPLSELKGWFEEQLNEYIIPCEFRVVGHNFIDYDAHWTKECLELDIFSTRCVVRDTYVLSRLAFPKRPQGHSVNSWGEKFGLKKTEIDDDKWDVFDPIMVTRCITDVLIQERIYDHLREKELRGYSVSCIELEHEVQRLISKQRRDGIFLDAQKVHELFAETKRHADNLEKEIQSVFPPKFKLLKEYQPRRTKNGEWAKRSFGNELDERNIGGDFSAIHLVHFNIDSPNQRLGRLLSVGWKPTEKTPTGAPKLTADSLKNLPEDAPKEAKLIGEYLMTRSRQRLAEQLIDGMDKDGYIHGYINTIGANTHRCASNSPNLQNIPSVDEDKVTKTPLKGLVGTWGYECRDVFCVERPDQDIFVDVDAKGIQIRGLAHYCNNKDYINIVSDPSMDIHKVHGDALGVTRPKSKTFCYAYIMGAQERKLISILEVPRDEGIHKLNQFYERFPFIQEFRDRLDKDVERGYFIALDGRLIALDKEYPHKAISVALQSFEAIIMKRSLVDYPKVLNKLGFPFIQRLFVHDEFLIQTKIPLAEQVGVNVSNVIKVSGEIYRSNCPVDGSFKIGKTWTIH